LGLLTSGHERRYLNAALKAQHHFSRGQRPRKNAQIIWRPVRATQDSIDPIDSVHQKEPYIFSISERTLLEMSLFLVMLFLFQNILSHGVKMGWAHAENAVAVLPTKIPEITRQGFDKFG
jgi:hypothetical protein